MTIAAIQSRALRIVCLVVALCVTHAVRAEADAIADIKDIAGTWEGTVDIRGERSPATMIIGPDGSWQHLVRTRGTFNGSVTVENGVARWHSKTTGGQGTLRLHTGPGKRRLILESDSGIGRGEYFAK